MEIEQNRVTAVALGSSSAGENTQVVRVEVLRVRVMRGVARRTSGGLVSALIYRLGRDRAPAPASTAILTSPPYLFNYLFIQ